MNFDYIEVIPAQFLRHIPKSLNLVETNHIESKLLRLILGTCDIRDSYTLGVIKQRNNYSNALNSKNTNVTSSTIKSLLSPITLSQVDNYLAKNYNVNYSLINDLLYEYSYFFLNEKKGNHTTAFIHLYRILEYISYSFPLVHASTSKNFIGTFSSLKAYFAGDGNELKFLEIFIERLFDSDPILASTFDINVQHSNRSVRDKLYAGFHRVLPSENAEFNDSIYRVTITYSDLLKIIIQIRNRFFHFAVGGQKNIRSSEIENPDLFFKHINNHAINWISIIYFEVFKTLVDRWS
ncbi:MAG: hypothetical protein U5N56_07890 [Candidatus Marinimicrobia bacterium]|nr:hypothetical protein [Candidatus Neomarinimicrobiota bacterium]